MLTYTEHSYRSVEENVERTIKVGNSWGCYTPRGNGILKRAATTLVKNIESIKDNEDITEVKRLTKYVEALAKYVQKYDDLCDSGDCDGASDTYVREIVWDFLENVCKAINKVKLADMVWTAIRYN